MLRLNFRKQKKVAARSLPIHGLRQEDLILKADSLLHGGLLLHGIMDGGLAHGRWTSSWSRYWEEDVVPQGSCPELLLEMIQGWYLLCDGLDTNMKIFVAETKGADIIVAGGSMMPAMKIVYGCLATHLFSPHIDQIPRRHRLI